MSEPFVGEIRMFAGNFAPRGYAFADGQLLQISQNDALFALYGTTYGGDGRTTFALPDLRGRVPIHAGSGAGPGLTSRPLGQRAGVENAGVSVNQLPLHTHALTGSTVLATEESPVGNVLAQAEIAVYSTETPLANMNSQAVGDAPGGGGTHPNVMPFLCINFIVSLTGIFPSRN